MMSNDGVMSRSSLRRIKSEEKQWIDYDDEDNYICYLEEEHSVYIICVRPIYYVKQVTFKVVLNEYYPFKKPAMFYSMDLENWKEMKNFYRLYNDRMAERYKEVTGDECMCCKSILCGDNWSAKILMKDVACEMKCFLNIKERMNEKLLSEVVLRRDDKLPDEIWKYIREYI